MVTLCSTNYKINECKEKENIIVGACKMIKKYKFGLDIWGLLIFLIIMAPNFIWFAVPAPNDVLRTESVTPIIDGIASVCQVIFVAALCIVKRRDAEKINATPLMVMVVVSVVLYFAGWIFYYIGVTNPAVILLLTLPPCAAFVLFAADRKNIIAMIPAIGFTFCHIVYSVINFIF